MVGAAGCVPLRECDVAHWVAFGEPPGGSGLPPSASREPNRGVIAQIVAEACPATRFMEDGDADVGIKGCEVDRVGTTREGTESRSTGGDLCGSDSDSS